MGLFRKKSDPISERAKALNDQIAALEAEIQRLAEKEPAQEPEAPLPRSPFAAAAGPSKPPSASPSKPASKPRLRSTAMPHGQASAQQQTPEATPVFEEVDQERIKADSPPAAPPPNELGVRKDDLASTWQRMKNHFRGPVASNPKLVHYLSAGSIQGLRPLRYEKRVARNRFIFFAGALVLALWGLIAMIMRWR